MLRIWIVLLRIRIRAFFRWKRFWRANFHFEIINFWQNRFIPFLRPLWRKELLAKAPPPPTLPLPPREHTAMKSGWELDPEDILDPDNTIYTYRMAWYIPGVIAALAFSSNCEKWKSKLQKFRSNCSESLTTSAVPYYLSSEFLNIWVRIIGGDLTVLSIL